MTTAMLTTTGKIRAGHAVRNAFSCWSTGNDQGCYYSTKGHAVNAFDNALQEFDLCLDRNDLADFYGDAGAKTIEVHDDCENCVGYARLVWYRMEESGRYEFIGYIT